jgi:hypothetical protein
MIPCPDADTFAFVKGEYIHCTIKAIWKTLTKIYSRLRENPKSENGSAKLDRLTAKMPARVKQVDLLSINQVYTLWGRETGRQSQETIAR